jgi:hypothetical protein
MKTSHKLILAVLAGFGMGVIGALAIHAQQTKTPLGYLLAEVDVREATNVPNMGRRFRKRWHPTTVITSSVAARFDPSRVKHPRIDSS